MQEEQKKTLMFLDDDPFIVDMYAIKLNKDFDFHSFTNPVEALDALEKGLSPDILLVDIVMPQMSGIEFLEKVREKNLIPNALVIVLSNQDVKENIERAKELGAKGYIIKANAVPSEVVSMIKALIKKYK